MEDTMTWIEVASDAVKIGLGVLIGGGISLLSAMLSHSHRKNEEYTTRRRDSLQTIMPEFEELSLDIMAEGVKVMNAFPKVNFEEVEIDKSIYDYSKRSKPVGVRNRKLNVIEAKVALLDFGDLATSINSFREQALAISKTETSSGAGIVKQFEKLENARNEVIQNFAKAYKSA